MRRAVQLYIRQNLRRVHRLEADVGIYLRNTHLHVCRYVDCTGLSAIISTQPVHGPGSVLTKGTGISVLTDKHPRFNATNHAGRCLDAVAGFGAGACHWPRTLPGRRKPVARLCGRSCPVAWAGPTPDSGSTGHACQRPFRFPNSVNFVSVSSFSKNLKRFLEPRTAA